MRSERIAQALYDAWRAGFYTGAIAGKQYEDAGPDMVTDVAAILRALPPDPADEARERFTEAARLWWLVQQQPVPVHDPRALEKWNDDRKRTSNAMDDAAVAMLAAEREGE